MSKRKPKCYCHLHEKQICDVCQRIGKRKPKDKGNQLGISGLRYTNWREIPDPTKELR